MKLASVIRFAVTAVVVIVAAIIGHALWKHYMYSPWTRDGRVRAEIVRIAPDVAGLVTDVRVIDNQTVGTTQANNIAAGFIEGVDATDGVLVAFLGGKIGAA